MSRSNRAVAALVSIVGLLAVFVMLSAASPSSAPPTANSLSVVSAQVSTPLTLLPSPTATPTLIPPTPTLTRRTLTERVAPKLAPTSFLPGRGPQLPGEFTFSGRRLDFYVGRGTFTTDEVTEMAASAEKALSYLQKRFDVSMRERVSVGVYNTSQAPGRGTRGIAYTSGETNIRIYYRPGEDKQKALVILSHELAHALQAQAYGKERQARSDTVLLEGLASWISGDYWLSLSGASSFEARARELYKAGYSGSLSAMGNRDLNAAYDMWAGFVDYLTRTYGWDSFNRLYGSGRGRAPGSADYQGIYGKSFNKLVDEYYATLR